MRKATREGGSLRATDGVSNRRRAILLCVVLARGFIMASTLSGLVAPTQGAETNLLLTPLYPARLIEAMNSSVNLLPGQESAALFDARSKPTDSGACSSVRWLLVLSTGRSGSTTIMRMLNAVPGIQVAGELGISDPTGQSSLLTHLFDAFDISIAPRLYPGSGYSFYRNPQDKELKDDICQWLLHLLPRKPSQVYYGFKELVWRDGGPLGIKRRRRLDIARVLALFPNVFVVRNFRLDIERQARSGFWANATSDVNRTIAYLSSNREMLLSSTQAVPHFDLPLEHFSTRRFKALLTWLDIRNCGFRRVAWANQGDTYTNRLEDAGLLRGDCKHARRNTGTRASTAPARDLPPSKARAYDAHRRMTGHIIGSKMAPQATAPHQPQSQMPMAQMPPFPSIHRRRCVPPSCTRLFLYNHVTLRPVIQRVLGADALSWFDTQYTTCAESPRRCMPFDAEFADGVLQRELPHSIQAHFKERVEVVTSPEDADSVLWLVWDYALCVASGVQPIAWELGKGILTASCDAHVTLLRWLMTTSRWRRSDGRDFVFIIEDPQRWQLPFGSGKRDDAKWYMPIARTRYGATPTNASLLTVQKVLTKVVRSSILLTIEERRRPEERGYSRFVVIPYFSEPGHYRVPNDLMAVPQGANRPLLAAFVGTLDLHGNGECAVCENGVLPRDLRIKTADELSRQCATLTAPRSNQTNAAWASRECAIALDRLAAHRDNRSDLALAAGDELFLRPLRDAVFCPIVRGDSATSKRFYTAIRMGCIPVVISDHFMPALPDIVDSHSAYLQIPEATFLLPSFSLMSFLQHALHADGGHGVRRLLAKGAEIRTALTYEHTRRTLHGNAQPVSDVRAPAPAPAPDAVDAVMAQVLHVLHSPLGKEHKSQLDSPALYEGGRHSPFYPFMIFGDAGTGSTSLCWALNRHPRIRCDHELLRRERPCAMLHRKKKARHAQPSQSCVSALASLGDSVGRYLKRCNRQACGGELYHEDVPPPHTVHEVFRNPYDFGVRIIKMVRLNEHAQYVEEEVRRWATRGAQMNGAGAHSSGSSPLKTAVPGWWGRKASCAIKGRCPYPRVLNETEFAAFRRDALRWRQEVETLRQTRHFVRLFTEEWLLSGSRLNRTTLDRVTDHIGVRRFSATAFTNLVAGHKALYHDSGVLFERG